MPTYEYRCPKGHEFEMFQRMSDPPLAACPECGEPAERILSGGAGLLFKGEGFYITDYRSESYKKAAEKDRPSGGGSKESGSSKGESKGQSKRESKGESGGGSRSGSSGSSGGTGSKGSGKGGE